jgi:hypothetical protein
MAVGTPPGDGKLEPVDSSVFSHLMELAKNLPLVMNNHRVRPRRGTMPSRIQCPSA